jgi:hypothetical protein
MRDYSVLLKIRGYRVKTVNAALPVFFVTYALGEVPATF